MRSLRRKCVHANLTLSLAVVLFIYDTLITFNGEVAYFWTAKRTGGASLLFFANRWISMTLYVSEMVGFVALPSDKVSTLSQYQDKSDRYQRFV